MIPILNETNRQFAPQFKVYGFRLDKLLGVAFLVIVLITVVAYFRPGAGMKKAPVNMAKRLPAKSSIQGLYDYYQHLY
jgi:hypothetical protein